MSDGHDLLARATQRAPEPRFTVLDLERRRDRRHGAARIRAAVVAVAIAGIAIGWGPLALRERAPLGTVSAEPAASVYLPPATSALPAATEVDFHYLRTLTRYLSSADVGDDGTLTHERWREGTCDIWWRADGSGRQACDWEPDGSRDETYAAGGFPIEIDTSPLPTTTVELAARLAGPDLPSPVAEATHTLGADPSEARIWRAAENLLLQPNATPALRAVLLDVLAGLSFASVNLDATDPVGRPAYRIAVVDATNGASGVEHAYFADPATHELLAYAEVDLRTEAIWYLTVVVGSGVTSSTDEQPAASIVPSPVLGSLEPVRTSGDVVERCSQGGPDLQLVFEAGTFDTDCLVVEAGAPFTITLRVEEVGVEANVAVYAGPYAVEPIFVGEIVTGPGTTTYELPGLDGPGKYVFRDDQHPETASGFLYVR